MNKVVCQIVTFLIKVIVFALVTVVRWVSRIVCTVVTLIVGLLIAIFDGGAKLWQAIKDTWTLIKEAFYTGIGVVILGALRLADAVQTGLGLQSKPRQLTDPERDQLKTIFGDSLLYPAIRVVEGKLGILGIGQSQFFTQGFRIYSGTVPIPREVLVHECVHVWQFQFEGTKYIGQSSLMQLDSMLFSPGYDPYAWQNHLSPTDPSKSWYQLVSIEEQAAFIEAVFTNGRWRTGRIVHGQPGAFFRLNPRAEDEENWFRVQDAAGQTIDYTAVANEAWRLLRTGT